MSEFFYYMFQPYWKYADFSGRARRKEFWAFILFIFATFVLIPILAVIGSGLFVYSFLYFYSSVGELFALLFALLFSPLFLLSIFLFQLLYSASFIPGLAVWFRRAHDVNLSGWYVCVPYIALAILAYISFFMAFLLNVSETGVNGLLIFAGIMGAIIGVCFVALCIYVGFWRGNKGSNKYGSDPLSEELVKRSITFSGGGMKRFFYYMFLPFRKCITFSGRGRRLEFWAFTLFVHVVFIFISILEGSFDFVHYYDVMKELAETKKISINTNTNLTLDIGLFGGISLIVFFVLYIPLLARRMHDINMSAWFLFLYVGAIVFFILPLGAIFLEFSDTRIISLLALSILNLMSLYYFTLYISLRLGDVGANRYGDDPLTEKVA